MKPSSPGIEEPTEFEAIYTLETPVPCPTCRETMSVVHVVRLLRTQVNFTSSLPRRGCIACCPACGSAVPAALG